MKKTFRAALLVMLAVLLLTGCSDATAEVSDSKQVLMKIGKTTITKGDMYDAMLNDDAGNAVVNRAMSLIANTELETTDDIRQRAQELYDSYKKQMETDDRAFEDMLKDYGYESTEAFMDYCIATTKSEDLVTKYIDDNWDALVEQHHPLKAKMIYLAATEETANAVYDKAVQALEEIKNGKPFDQAAEEYNDTDSLAEEKLYTRSDDSLDYNVLQYLVTATTTGLSGVIPNAKVNGYYIVMVTNANALQLKDDFVDKLTNDSDFVEEAHHFYFQKHNFTIYDIDIYNTIKNNYSAYLVQD